jgi:hypothetical protein
MYSLNDLENPVELTNLNSITVKALTDYNSPFRDPKQFTGTDGTKDNHLSPFIWAVCNDSGQIDIYDADDLTQVQKIDTVPTIPGKLSCQTTEFIANLFKNGESYYYYTGGFSTHTAQEFFGFNRNRWGGNWYRLPITESEMSVSAGRSLIRPGKIKMMPDETLAIVHYTWPAGAPGNQRWDMFLKLYDLKTDEVLIDNLRLPVVQYGTGSSISTAMGFEIVYRDNPHGYYVYIVASNPSSVEGQPGHVTAYHIGPASEPTGFLIPEPNIDCSELSHDYQLTGSFYADGTPVTCQVSRNDGSGIPVFQGGYQPSQSIAPNGASIWE